MARSEDEPLFNRGFSHRLSESESGELVSKVSRVFATYAQAGVNVLNPMVRRGENKAVLASVPGRPEDEQLAIDAIGEHILTGLIRDNVLPALVLGEHNTYDLSSGNPQIVIATDSFDNTSQYKRGLDTSPYTVIGGYYPDGTPLACAIGDIKDKKAYVSIGGNNFLLDLETGETKEIIRSQRTTIKDDNFTLASYLGSNEYSLKFILNFANLIDNKTPKGVLYAGGGSFIYGLLATGAVDAYVMFDEPYSEIIPGLPIALAAGCTVVSVNPDGSYQDFRLTPDIWKNPDVYHKGEVPLFITACTPELRDEIIRYYLEAQPEIKREKDELKREKGRDPNLAESVTRRVRRVIEKREEAA